MTLDSFNAFTLTFTSQNVLWKFRHVECDKKCVNNTKFVSYQAGPISPRTYAAYSKETFFRLSDEQCTGGSVGENFRNLLNDSICGFLFRLCDFNPARWSNYNSTLNI